MNTYIIIAIVFVLAVGTTYAIAYFHGSKKAGNIDNVIKEVDTLSPLLMPVVTYAEGRLPEPIRSKATQIVSGISDGIVVAENGYKNGLLTAESRKEFAQNAVNTTLLKLNIKPSEVTANVISKAIDLAVALFLPISNASGAGAVTSTTATTVTPSEPDISVTATTAANTTPVADTSSVEAQMASKTTAVTLDAVSTTTGAVKAGSAQD